MATFVRVQEIEHEIGSDGRFSLRVTSPDVELRGVAGPVARVRIEFELRAANDAEADEAFEEKTLEMTETSEACTMRP